MLPYTMLAQTAMSVLRCQYRSGTGSLVLQEFTGTGLIDMALDAADVERLLRILPTALLEETLRERGGVSPKISDAHWPSPSGEMGMLTLDLDPPTSAEEPDAYVWPVSAGTTPLPPTPHPIDRGMACVDPRCAYCHATVPARQEAADDPARYLNAAGIIDLGGEAPEDLVRKLRDA